MANVGLLHPGDMGSAVAVALRQGGSRVLWCSAGRSQATVERARAAGADELTDLAELVGVADIIISVCPPHAAEDVAGSVIELGFSGIYLDANAVSPRRALRIGELVASAGARAVDGGIIGLPPKEPGTTRLYLAGEEAGAVARLFEGTLLEPRVLTGALGSASALKMAYAATTKGTAALTSISRALAEHHGVEDSLLQEWGDARDAMIERAAAVAWRWRGEMEEIADSCDDAGLPGEMHRGAAEVYRRWEGRRDRLAPAAEVLAELLRPR